MARATASAAARPSAVRSARTSPTESVNSVSPSTAVCGGESARANPVIPSSATLTVSALLSRASVAITPIVVFSGAKPARRAPLRSARAVSISRRPSGASRAPARSAPVSGSRTSPTALTATRAPTTAPSARVLALPIPPRIARSIRWSLPTVAPVPAPTLPSPGAAGVAFAAAAYPISRVGRARMSPTLRSNRIAAATWGTTVGPARKPIPRPSRKRMTPHTASRP